MNTRQRVVAYALGVLVVALTAAGIALARGWVQPAYAVPLLGGVALFTWLAWTLRPRAGAAPAARAPAPATTRSRGRWWFRWVALSMALACGEGLAFVAFKTGLFHFEVARSYLLGEAAPRQFIPLPALTYGPGPSFARGGVQEHNALGFRGDLVPLARTPGRRRILCLGGSTTYGISVRPEESYPAQLRAQLEADLPAGWAGVEVINAGLPLGTSAEVLTHYLLKYAYFEPDLVVLHVGGNDAQPAFPEYEPHYQPDYSHWRRPLRVPAELTPLGKRLASSRLIAFGLILLVYSDDPGRRSLLRDPGPPPVAWHTGGLTEQTFAFPRNLETLVCEARRRGSEVLLLPFLPSPGSEGPMSAPLERCRRVVFDVGERLGVTVAPHPPGLIAPEHYVDHAGHLDAEGCRQKAAHVVPYVRQLLAE